MGTIAIMYNLPTSWEKFLTKNETKGMTEDDIEKCFEWVHLNRNDFMEQGYWTIPNHTAFRTKYHEASRVGIEETECFEYFYVYEEETPPQ